VAGVTERRGRFAVYNFEVEGTHTYHAGPGGRWVHNTCEIHHIATNKDYHRGWTETFRDVFDRVGVGMNDPANRVPVPGWANQGPHPPAYHDWVWRKWRNIHDAETADDLRERLRMMGDFILNNPGLINNGPYPMP
jgi:hypothetical protein